MGQKEAAPEQVNTFLLWNCTSLYGTAWAIKMHARAALPLGAARGKNLSVSVDLVAAFEIEPSPCAHAQ